MIEKVAFALFFAAASVISMMLAFAPISRWTSKVGHIEHSQMRELFFAEVVPNAIIVGILIAATLILRERRAIYGWVLATLLAPVSWAAIFTMKLLVE